jgi:hypothetical protein
MVVSEIAAARSLLNFRKPLVGHFFSWFVSLTKLNADDHRAHKTRDLCTSFLSDRNRSIPFCVESGHWRVRLRRTPMFCSLLSLKMRLPRLWWKFENPPERNQLTQLTPRRRNCTRSSDSPDEGDVAKLLETFYREPFITWSWRFW